MTTQIEAVYQHGVQRPLPPMVDSAWAAYVLVVRASASVETPEALSSLPGPASGASAANRASTWANCVAEPVTIPARHSRS